MRQIAPRSHTPQVQRFHVPGKAFCLVRRRQVGEHIPRQLTEGQSTQDRRGQPQDDGHHRMRVRTPNHPFNHDCSSFPENRPLTQVLKPVLVRVGSHGAATGFLGLGLQHERTIDDDPIAGYALSRRVVPVSPNSIFARSSSA